jgi:hypothetical protein
MRVDDLDVADGKVEFAAAVALVAPCRSRRWIAGVSSVLRSPANLEHTQTAQSHKHTLTQRTNGIMKIEYNFSVRGVCYFGWSCIVSTISITNTRRIRSGTETLSDRTPPAVPGHLPPSVNPSVVVVLTACARPGKHTYNAVIVQTSTS